MFKMFFNVTKKAKEVLPKQTKVEVKEEAPVEAEVAITEKVNPSSKKVYAFVGKKCVGEYDSITLCASALGMSRPMVKKAIESGVVLTNGFILKLTSK